jgi:hypothetical protein
MPGPSVEKPEEIKGDEMNHIEQNPMDGLNGKGAVEEPAGAELWRIWTSEIKPYFIAEEGFLRKYGDEAGYDQKYIARVLGDHRMMEAMVWRNGDEGVRDFARMLAVHIRYKEDFFSQRVRLILESEEVPSWAGNP